MSLFHDLSFDLDLDLDRALLLGGGGGGGKKGIFELFSEEIYRGLCFVFYLRVL